LVRRQCHLVAKEEILEQIWPDSFVEENNVEKRVHQLRKFLGKSKSRQSSIETIRGQGYRFVGRVIVVEVSGTWGGSATASGEGKSAALDCVEAILEGMIPKSIPVMKVDMTGR